MNEDFFRTTMISMETTDISILESSLSYEVQSTVAIKTFEEFKAPIAVHIICVTAILVIGLFGNAFAIRYYARKSLTSGNAFIIALAILDIVIIVLVVPQIPLFRTYIVMRERSECGFCFEGFLMFLFFFMHSYLSVLVCMALDRVYAVFRPYTYTQSWKRSLYASASGVAFSGALVTISYALEIEDTKGLVSRTANSVFIMVSCTVIIASYAAISCKLRRHRRQIQDGGGNRIKIRDNSVTATTSFDPMDK